MIPFHLAVINDGTVIKLYVDSLQLIKDVKQVFKKPSILNFSIFSILIVDNRQRSKVKGQR
jgi:ABC-type phosphate transport system ATPase subunit